MTGLVRFSVSMDARLLERFDRFIAEKGFTSRSEAL
ncbi:MAG TPA: nickel-responsive transcriptional regulator NikR, partial [Clostridiales bacterium]|nr:nickel-responsive transcriptional regulator NikR [Clostridiales bacterium]